MFVSGRLLSCHGGDNTVENFLICSDEEVKKRLQKKAKKVRNKIRFTWSRMKEFFFAPIKKKLLWIMKINKIMCDFFVIKFFSLK